MDEKEQAASAARDKLCKVIRAMLARAESGETTGLLGWEAHQDGSNTRFVVGSVRADRHRLAGLAVGLAMEAARD